MKDIRDYSLLAHNTFGIDAKCKRFLEYSSVEEAQQIVAGLTAADQPLLILGGGSNLLLTGDYEGTVIHSAIKGIEVLDNETLAAAGGENLKNPDFVFLNCGSGEVFDDVVAYAVEHGYHGAENLSIIPGEVGASAIQNIGAYGVEAKDIIYKVETVELLPEVDSQYVSVIVSYPGASTESVEQQVTKPIEEELSSISHFKQVRSATRPGRSEIFVELDADADELSTRRDSRAVS